MNLDTSRAPEAVKVVAQPLVIPQPQEQCASWDEDLALVSSEQGGDFVAWFERTTVSEEDCWRFIDSVPLSRIYEIADEARRRSEVWQQLAKSLDVRWSKRK